MREHVVELVYAPPNASGVLTAGFGVARIPWTDKWQRVTYALFRVVATLARHLDWASVSAHFHLNWMTVAAVVEGARGPGGYSIAPGSPSTCWGSTR